MADEPRHGEKQDSEQKATNNGLSSRRSDAARRYTERSAASPSFQRKAAIDWRVVDLA
jgi:hypothetical protein